MKKQQGLTLITWLILGALIGFNVILGLNVVPVYINDNSVKSIMESLETDVEARGVTQKKLREIIVKRLKINNIYSINKDDIYISKGSTFYEVTIEYEPRGKLIGNLDYIVTFEHSAEVPIKK